MLARELTTAELPLCAAAGHGAIAATNKQITGAGGDTMEQLKLALGIRPEPSNARRSDEEAVAGQTEALKDRELRDFAAQSPEAKEQLGKLSEALKNRSKEIKANAAAQKDGLKQLLYFFGQAAALTRDCGLKSRPHQSDMRVGYPARSSMTRAALPLTKVLATVWVNEARKKIFLA